MKKNKVLKLPQEQLNEAFINAAQNNHFEMMKYLVDIGADFRTTRDRAGYNALMNLMITPSRNFEAIEYLYKLGIDLNYTTHIHGFNVLSVAARRYGNEEVIQKLIDYGVKVDIREDSNDTALIVAAEENNPEIVKVLLKNGAKINLKNKEGMTALMEASLRRNLECVEILIEHNAKVNLRNKEGQTALTIVKKYTNGQQQEVIMALKKAGAVE